MEAMSQYMWWIISGLTLGILIVWKNLYQFHWFNFWYGMPLIGTMSRLKDVTPDSADKSWTRAERKLCTDYAQFIKIGDIGTFNRRTEYLRKAGDLGVKPMPSWLNIALWVLILAEGFGFAYSLGTWLAMEGSENIHTLLMVAVALVIAVPSAMLSHEAGVRFHRYMERKRNYQDWKNEDHSAEFKSGAIDIQMDQSVDNNKPSYTQYANRAHPKISLLPLYGALAWAVVVVVGSTTMRISHLETVMAEEAMGCVQQSAAASSNPFAPQELTVPQDQAGTLGCEDKKGSALVEGMAAFTMLAFLYLATQGVGAAVAAKHAYLGAQSEVAYKGNFGFQDFDDFRRYYEPLEQIAQARLQTLQERLGSDSTSNRGVQFRHTFVDYLDAEAKKSAERKLQYQTGQHSTYSEPTKASAAAADSIEAAQAHIVGLSDKQDQIAYFQTLPSNVQDQLKPWLKQRKEEEESKKNNLEELF